MNPIVERKVSGFQLSISTGMAMETLFDLRATAYDPDRTPPPRASLADYDSLWINVDTLLRNIINASTYGDARELRPEMVGGALEEEIDLIQNLCSIEGKGQLTPFFYATNYTDYFRKKSPEYKPRVPTSGKQVAWFQALDGGRNFTIKNGAAISEFGHTGLVPKQPGERILIISHLPPDLLSYRDFGKMELLESHTGVIKTRRQWNTKYHPLGPEKFENMPWCRPLLCYLGDKYVFAPLSINVRKKLLELSQRRKWTPMTEPATVHNDCMTKINDDNILRVLRQITLY